jgi:hypothetical protein
MDQRSTKIWYSKRVHRESGQIGPMLHGAFKKKSKITFQSFKKIDTKNLDVDNYEIY